MKRIATLLLLLLVLTPAAATLAAGGPPGPTSKMLIFTTLQGPITQIDYGKHTLVVNEQSIRLIHQTINGRLLTTMLRNALGAPIEWGILHRGTLVFVRGFRQPNGEIWARGIYLLPKGAGSWHYAFQKAVPDWPWQSGGEEGH